MNLLRKLLPKKRITVTTAFLLLLGATILFAYLPNMTWLSVLAFLGAFVTGAIAATRLAKAIVRHTIWRLRNRLIVTYVFIGVVPLVLVLALVGLGGYMFAGQTAMYLVSSELERTMFSLAIPAQILAQSPNDPPLLLLERSTNFLKERFPTFELTVQKDGKILHYPPGSSLPLAETSAPEYVGLTSRNGIYCAWSHHRLGSLVVDMVAPIDREMLASLVPGIGQVELTPELGQSSSSTHSLHVGRRRTSKPGNSRSSEANTLPAPANQFDYEVNWFTPMNIAQWGTGAKLDSQYLVVTTRPSALLGAIFSEKYKAAQFLLFALVAIAALFLIVELVSLVIGVSLTRSITGAIESLYDGTRRVAEGDFSHRIKVKGKDQLASVNASFNSMTERIEQLVIVEKEKERLQSELEIAREVQDQLFPHISPKMKTIEITGLCRPARMVSGDYYDYLCLQESSLALAIGDVAGKGISAALLMASIQSIMRTQLSSIVPVMAATANGSSRHSYSTSHMVSQLNRQLYLSTSPEKYATFLFGIYDEQDRTLTYTNAGHLPPILIRRGVPTLLEVTGTVVGAFPASRYEEQKILLEPGDLLVSYTDGITEPENEYGEEFGVDRLVETFVKNQKLEAEPLINCVMDAVRAWTTAPELPDDMTLMLVRRNA